jgi:regulator of sirC expression with transglutaminase-like and TPR domain
MAAMALDPHPFDLFIQQPEGDIRLAEAALLFARDLAPEVDFTESLTRLESLAERVGSLHARTPEEQVQALRVVLVEEEGFQGNREDYADPRNSLLHEVLRRRLGIPISLAVVWLDVAEQLGWPLVGVGLPWHFMTALRWPGGEILVDCYGGKVLDRHGCAALLNRLSGHSVQLSDEHFEATPKRLILTRMLNNLVPLYTEAEDWPRAVAVMRRLVALHPGARPFRTQLELVESKLVDLN